VVNDAQKMDLVERLALWRRRSDRMFSVVLLLIILWQLTRYDWITAFSELVGVHSEILGVTIFVLIMLIFAFANPILQLCAIRPLLLGTVPKPGKVGLWDSLFALPRSLAESSSLPVVLLCAAIVVNGGFLWYRALTANGTQLSLIVLLAVGFVVTVPILVMVAALFMSSEPSDGGSNLPTASPHQNGPCHQSVHLSSLADFKDKPATSYEATGYISNNGHQCLTF
jgi:hypothetical protein